MGTPDTINNQQFSTTIYLLAQQMASKLRGSVMVDPNWTGEKKFYNQLNQEVFEEILARNADTPIQNSDFRRRMVSPRFFVSATLEDPKDALQTIVDPKSTQMQAKKAAGERLTDDIIISAMGGTSYTGKDGTTAVTFPDAQKLAVNYKTAGTGMTKAKCIGARRLLNTNEVENTDRYAACTSEQEADMLNSTEVASSDFNVVKALVEGTITQWLGFTWIRSERLLTDTNEYRLCYFYQKMALQLAIQKEITSRLSERDDKNYAWQLYVCMCMGATRLEEGRIVQVPCVETWGS